MTPKLGRLDDFQAELTHRSFDNLALNQVDGPSHGVLRTPGDLAKGGEQYLFVNLCLSGRSSVRQQGQEAQAAVGQLLIFDSSTPFELEQIGEVKLLSLAVPHSAIGMHGTSLSLSPRCLSGSMPAALLANQMSVLAQWNDPLAPLESNCVAELMVGTVRALVSELAGAAPALPQRRKFNGKLRALIERHYGDPGFSPAQAACQLGISVRTLHAWLAHDQANFSSQLLQYRLERAHAMLSAAANQISIMDVALRCGFVSGAHFSRRFRDQYGHAPSALRNAY